LASARGPRAPPELGRPRPLARQVDGRHCRPVLPWFTPASAVERVRGMIAGVIGSGYDVMLFDVESEDRQ
jgi:hypothetical protein